MSQDRPTVAPQIVDEASEWFVMMRDPEISAEDRAAFADWLRASPVHVGAYVEIARLWGDASRIDEDLKIDLASASFPNVVAIKAATAKPGRRSHASSVASRAKRGGWLALAASIALAVVGGGVWFHFERAPTYATEVGEQRTITLEDGSTVKLNSRSEFKVRLSPQRREIELVAGQALFDVAHDPARPFIVTSGNSAIRAVGTQFDVNRKNSGTVVTVIQGRVKLDALEAESRLPPHEIYLSAGEQMRIAVTGDMLRSANPDTTAAIGWLQQELAFDGQPLSDVLEEFNRYTRTPIVLADPSLGDLRINAVFHTTNPDSLLLFISRFDNVRVERTTDEIRILRK
jgi:transmembrane sensor